MSINRERLGQWFTPAWAAEALIERHFPGLGRSDCVIEPSCGDGAFLQAIPADVEAVGVEIDPYLAALAEARTGRHVVVGDFRTVPLPYRPSAIIGNPPFKAEVIEGMLQRSLDLLQPEGLAGFILPAYVLQTPSVVARYAARWSMQAELLPRTLFPRLSKPLVFALFRKSERRLLIGFALFEETHDVERMPAGVRETLTRGRASVWRSVVDQVLSELDGEAGLDAIYASIAPRRPTTNRYWQEKVRQVLQLHHIRTGPGRWRRAAALESAA